MAESTPRLHAAPLRRLARATVRGAALVLGASVTTRRHLLRLRFGSWAIRWLSGPAVVAWRGVRVEVDPGEAHGFHVFAHGDYGGAELDACVEACRNARVFVDVGAHIGLIALAVARACPAVRVVAVEADPAVASWLRRNLARNPDVAPRVILLEAAAADIDGEVPFTPTTGSENIGTGHVSAATGEPGRRVPAVRLGAWLAARGLSADVVKMDVEGGELPALDGLWADGPPPRAILLETHGHLFDPAEAFNRRVLHALTSRGYRVERLERGQWAPVSDPRILGGRSHLRARLAPGASGA